MGRVMGVDVGTARVGVALSDELGITARPLTVLVRRGDKGTAIEIRDLASEHEVTRIVVGLPLGLDGRTQESTDDARRMAEAVRLVTSLEVVEWDERLTSVQAERSLIEGNVRREKRRQIIDMVAAALMLQSFLDRESGMGDASSPGGADGSP